MFYLRFVIWSALALVESQPAYNVSFIPPKPYAGISSLFIESSKSMYYHSGVTDNGSFLLGLHRFYYDEIVESWRTAQQQSYNIPDPRQMYGSFFCNNKYYIYGGIGPNGIYNDLWSYDLLYEEWTQIVVPEPISPRYGFSYTSFTYEQVFYFAVLGGNTYNSTIEEEILTAKSNGLFDFYLYVLFRYDVAENAWIEKTSYESCMSGTALLNGQLQFVDGIFYMFSGYYVAWYGEAYYNSLCSLRFTGNAWNLVQNGTLLLNSTGGGSCIYENYIYYFFSSASITRLNLKDMSEPFQNIAIEGCWKYILRNQFGYSCNESQFYVFGGYFLNRTTNSVLNFTLTGQSSIMCSLVYDDVATPGPRHGSTMEYITGGFLLFGGSNKGMLLNDLWFFNLTNQNWKEIFPVGTSPSPRRKHAAAIQGSFMVIVGGYGVNDITLADYFLLNYETLTWEQLSLADNSPIPPPIACTCLLLDLPIFYYVGGINQEELTLTLWSFDLTDSMFTEIYQYDPSSIIGLANHNCALVNDIYSTYILTFFGSRSLSDLPFCGVIKFNLTEPIVTPYIIIDYVQNMPCLTNLILSVLYDGSYLFVGGQQLKQETSTTVFNVSINFSKEIYYSTIVGNLSYPAYASGATFINNTLYVYSGFLSDGITINGPSSDAFQKLDLLDYNPRAGPICGQGFFDNGEYCDFCEMGTYKDNNSPGGCNFCPNGTSNTVLGATNIIQCILCPFGKYSTNPSIPCQNCTLGDVCFVGTGNNSISSYDQEQVLLFFFSDSQPPVYEPPDTSDKKAILYIAIGSLMLLFVIIYFLSRNLRIILSYYDIFKNFHFQIYSSSENTENSSQSIIPTSKFGGFCTVVTIILLIAITCSILIDYCYTNVIENITSVPVNSLSDEHNFGDIEFTLDLMFQSYRGDCTTEFAEISVSYDIYDYSTFANEEGSLCTFTTVFKSESILTSGDFISYYFSQASSLTSDINVRIGVDSSIPGYRSIVTDNITSPLDKVFRGAASTTFSFSLLASYYEEHSAIGTVTSGSGYQISENSEVSPGSLSNIGLIPISQGLSITVELSLSDIGISTFKYPQIDLFTLIIVIFSNYPGTIGLIGFLMWFVEYLRVAYNGHRSGRIILARKEIEEERKSRAERKQLLPEKEGSFLDPGRNQINS